MIRRWCYFPLIALGVASNAIANSGNERWIEAESCTRIDSRLERLACFDSVFKTPVNVALNKTANVDVPESWQRAFDSYRQYQIGDVSHLTALGEKERGDAWVTLVALNEQTAFDNNAKPILIMSCIDNLSRVELAFPSAIDDPQVNISIFGMPAQSWRSDDEGVLFSSGRGIPAIEMMKAMEKQQRLILRSNSRVVDGLWFDATTLSQSLDALRTRCGW